MRLIGRVQRATHYSSSSLLFSSNQKPFPVKPPSSEWHAPLCWSASSAERPYHTLNYVRVAVHKYGVQSNHFPQCPTRMKICGALDAGSKAPISTLPANPHVAYSAQTTSIPQGVMATVPPNKLPPLTLASLFCRPARHQGGRCTRAI